MADYKASKEAFVSGQEGSSITHIALISSVAFVILSYFRVDYKAKLYQISLGLFNAFCARTNARPAFFVNWLCLAVPPLLSMTLFADRPLLLNATLLLIYWLFLHTHTLNVASRSAAAKISVPVPPGQLVPLPAVTSYRAHMLLLTMLSILAVDFPVFPRYLAKCESFGTSMMDLGVGSFVFGQGLVSAIPLLKQPRYLTSPVVPKFLAAMRKSLPVLFLGLARVLLVKGTDYPEHVTEYGVHWNFFLTLAILPPLQILFHPLIIQLPISIIGLVVASLHQTALNVTSLQDFALYAPRTNLVSMNKEGLVSIPGYLAIHLLGLLTGAVILPPSPSYFRRLRKLLRLRDDSGELEIKIRRLKDPQRRELDKTTTELFALALLWSTLLAAVLLYSGRASISRRLANLPYVLWVAAYNTSALLIYIFIDTFSLPPNPPKLKKESALVEDLPEPDLPLVQPAPALLEAINRNGLLIFLLANVLTGVVNLTMRTMYASDATAVVLLSIYSLVISSVAWVTKHKRLLSL